MSERRTAPAEATRQPQPPPPQEKPGSNPPPVESPPPPDPANVPTEQPPPPGEPTAAEDPTAVVSAEPVAANRSLYFRDTSSAQAAWARARASNANTVGTLTTIPQIQEGFAVALNVMRVDARDMSAGGEIYRISGDRYGLSKSALLKLAATAGVDWSSESGRIDDGRVQSYCHWHAVCTVREFATGNVRYMTADKVIDLQPGSALYKQWERAAAEKAAKDRRPEHADAYLQRRLDEFLPHITSQAETKAMLRCVRAILGLQTAYSLDVLKRPFVVPVIVPDTSTIRDPILRAEMTKARVLHALGLGHTLYGPGHGATRISVARPPTYTAPPPPQVPGPLDEDDGDPADGYA